MQSLAARDLVIACAAGLVYALAVLWLLIAFRHRLRLTVATAARIVVVGVLALLGSTILTHVVSDPRPYIVTHTQPLIAVSRDNGFPSDHVLLAAALTCTLVWIARRWMPLFAIATLLVAIGRLGVGAHHTEDVLGSIAIALAAALIAAALPLRGEEPLWPLIARWR